MFTWGRYYWPIALTVVSLMFLIPESIALITRSKNTLTYYARYELNLAPHVTAHTIAWWLSLLAVQFINVILILHIWGNQLG